MHLYFIYILDYDPDKLLTAEEVALITELMDALKPIETLATELGARDANLLVADGMMTLTMEELLSLNTETAKVLAGEFGREICAEEKLVNLKPHDIYAGRGKDI